MPKPAPVQGQPIRIGQRIKTNAIGANFGNRHNHLGVAITAARSSMAATAMILKHLLPPHPQALIEWAGPSGRSERANPGLNMPEVILPLPKLFWAILFYQ